VSNPRIVYRPREDATPEGELSTLSAVYKFVISQARRGEPHDLTNGSTAETMKNEPQKTERQKT
jgi:hypothetical protein